MVGGIIGRLWVCFLFFVLGMSNILELASLWPPSPTLAVTHTNPFLPTLHSPRPPRLLGLISQPLMGS